MSLASRIRFTQAARAEIIEAQDWYAAQAPGLGNRFRLQIDSAIQRIALQPSQFPVVLGNARRALVRDFPYSLFFRVDHDEIIVFACFHGSRNPTIWQRRT